MRLRFSPTLLAVALSATLGTAQASAQDATPIAFPITPDPAECHAATRPSDEVLALLGTPAASPAAGLPFSVPAETDLPAGTPADDATVGAIVATVRELIACDNSGDLARVFPFYTDDILRRALGGDASAALAVFLAAPPAGGSQAEILAVRGVRVLSDGRVGAVVEVRDARRTVVAFLVFVQAGDRWLVDGETDVQAAGTPAA